MLAFCSDFGCAVESLGVDGLQSSLVIRQDIEHDSVDTRTVGVIDFRRRVRGCWCRDLDNQSTDMRIMETLNIMAEIRPVWIAFLGAGVVFFVILIAKKRK